MMVVRAYSWLNGDGHDACGQGLPHRLNQGRFDATQSDGEVILIVLMVNVAGLVKTF